MAPYIDFEKLFDAFVDWLPDSERLDTPDYRGPKRADYLLCDRALVAELKELQNDQLEKMQAFAQEIMDERGLVLFGTLPFHQIVDKQPDKDQLMHRAIRKGGKRTQKVFEEANRQIKVSKETLGIPDAGGILVLANVGDSAWDPNVAVWFLHLLLNQRKEDGSPTCSSIDGIWYFSEHDQHEITTAEGIPARVNAVLGRDFTERGQRVLRLLDELQNDWSRRWRVLLRRTTDKYDGSGMEGVQTRGAGFRAGLPLPPNPIRVSACGWTGEPASTCRHCGQSWKRETGSLMPVNWTEQPQPGMLLIWFECPQCGGCLDIRVADIRGKSPGAVVAGPWLGTWDDLLRPDWSGFIET